MLRTKVRTPISAQKCQAKCQNQDIKCFLVRSNENQLKQLQIVIVIY